MNTTNEAYVPAAIVAALDEYGPILKWFGHWTDFEVGSVFYSVSAKHAEEVARSPLLVTPHTFGGFSGAFYVAKGRKPTEQEIFDAGVRSGLARAEEAKHVSAKKETCKPGGCSAIGCEGGHYCFRPDGTPIVVTPEKRQELERALAEVFNIAQPSKPSDSRQFAPPHPGETLREDVLPNLGLSVAEAAAKVGVVTEVFQGVLDGRVSINAEMALQIERWLGVENGGSASTWLALQGTYDLWRATHRGDTA
jgi:addiction module HigA family antidote